MTMGYDTTKDRNVYEKNRASFFQCRIRSTLVQSHACSTYGRPNQRREEPQRTPPHDQTRTGARPRRCGLTFLQYGRFDGLDQFRKVTGLQVPQREKLMPNSKLVVAEKRIVFVKHRGVDSALRMSVSFSCGFAPAIWNCTCLDLRGGLLHAHYDALLVFSDSCLVEGSGRGPGTYVHLPA